jgi:hypothetical protein
MFVSDPTVDIARCRMPLPMLVVAIILFHILLIPQQCSSNAFLIHVPPGIIRTLPATSSNNSRKRAPAPPQFDKRKAATTTTASLVAPSTNIYTIQQVFRINPA